MASGSRGGASLGRDVSENSATLIGLCNGVRLYVFWQVNVYRCARGNAIESLFCHGIVLGCPLQTGMWNNRNKILFYWSHWNYKLQLPICVLWLNTKLGACISADPACGSSRIGLSAEGPQKWTCLQKWNWQVVWAGYSPSKVQNGHTYGASASYLMQQSTMRWISTKQKKRWAAQIFLTQVFFAWIGCYCTHLLVTTAKGSGCFTNYNRNETFWSIGDTRGELELFRGLRPVVLTWISLVSTSLSPL